MRKIRNIFLMALSFVFCSAFAITEEQKEAFVNGVDAVVKNDNFKPTVEQASALEVVKLIADWAQEEPLEFREWVKDKNNRYIWTVRVAINKEFAPESLLDAVINDFDATNMRASENPSAYASLKAKGFKVEGIKMSDSKIFGLGKVNKDAEIFNYVSEGFLDGKFLDCVNIIRQSEQGAGILFNACQKVERIFFAKRKTDPTIKANWESFQADSNEIFMTYYKSQKLKSLNK